MLTTTVWNRVKCFYLSASGAVRGWFKGWGVTTRFFAMLFIITISIVCFFQWRIVRQTEKIMLDYSNESARVAAVRINQFLDSWMDNVNSILTLVASQRQLYTGPVNEQGVEQLRNYGESNGMMVKTLYIVRNDGQILSSKQVLYDILGNEFLAAIFEQCNNGYTNISWTEPYYTPLSDNTVAFALPVRDNNARLIGVTIAEVSIPYLINGISPIVTTEGDKSFILSSSQYATILYDSLGDILPYSRKFYPNRINDDFYSLIIKQPAGFSQLAYSGKVFHTFASSGNKMNWTVTIVSDSRLIDKRIAELWSGFATNLILWVCVSVIGSLLLSYFFTKPLCSLAARMDNVENLDSFQRIEMNRTDEIGKLAHSFNAMLDRIETLVADLIVVEARKKEYEMKMLQSQIGPHFLHNTLVCISSLARQQKNEQVQATIHALMNLLSYSFEKREELVSLESEIESILMYAEIHAARYGKVFDLDVQVSDQAKIVLIPKFTIQPIIENAIFHGILPKERHGIIRIKAYRVGCTLKIYIQDNGVGMDQERLTGLLDSDRNGRLSDRFNNIGLPNVDQRMKMYFGKNSGLSIISVAGKGTIVCVRVTAPS